MGTDSHTTMVNGLSVLGWGVGGIEAEAAMLGQPISMLIPEVIGFRVTGKLREGVTATDLVLTVTQMLRKKGVVGKFVEFFGPGLDEMTVEDRATIANMSPEYGATCGFFPIDAETLRYLKITGRKPARVALVEKYAKAQGLFRTAKSPEPVFTDTLELDLGDASSRASPARAGRRIASRSRNASTEFATALKDTFRKEGEALKPAPVQGADYSMRSWRCGDRGDHLLHQHVQSQRDDRRGSCREEGGRTRAEGEAVGEDIAGARAARSSPIISRRRAWTHTSTSSGFSWWVMAAPPASAIPARCPSRSPMRSTKAISWWRRCSPATAISKAACIRRCAQTISPRPCWWWPMRWRVR